MKENSERECPSICLLWAGMEMRNKLSLKKGKGPNNPGFYWTRTFDRYKFRIYGDGQSDCYKSKKTVVFIPTSTFEHQHTTETLTWVKERRQNPLPKDVS